MNPLVSGAIAGFVIGLAGFIIVQFWIRPIMGYRKIKKKIASNLLQLKKSAETGCESDLLTDEMSEAHRKLSSELSSCYSEILPHWYKILLGSRRENPMEACGHLMTLSNINDYDHATKRMTKLKISLGLG